MEQADGRMIVSASDLVGHLACAHITALEGEAAAGRRPRPERDDPELAVLQRRGFEHEAAHLAALTAAGLTVVEIPEPDLTAAPASGGTGRMAALREREARTLAAMEAGADVVYQATFLDETGPVVWRGHADFLRRVDHPSRLGDHAYEPVDTKLARHVRASAVLQLCHYAEQVGRLQGSEPERVHVVLGGREEVAIRLVEVSAYYRAARGRFLAAVGAHADVYPLPVPHCALCRWLEVCEERWEADDHLCRVAGLGGDQVRKLGRAGITTLAALAASPPGLHVRGITDPSLARLQLQARLQHSRPEGEPPPVALRPDVEEGRGLSALPAPDPGDVFYDIEGDPHVGDAGLEYLHGVGWAGPGGAFEFKAFWGHDEPGERRAYEGLIDFLVERRRRFPDMHVYHYANYERHALAKLTGRYGSREDELDDLLRGEVFVDLYRVVRQGLVVGSPSYSLKKLEPLYMPTRTGEITDAGSSVVEYERWLDGGRRDQSILDSIEAYNRTDVESTRLLRGWLEERRAELERSAGPIPRPVPATIDDEPEGALAPALATGEEVAAGLALLLLDGLDASDAPDASDDERARRLMAALLSWHRREARPEWWRYFERVLHSDEADLREDTECIAGLEPAAPPEPDGDKHQVFTYRFDPAQEHKFRAGSDVADPETARRRHNLGPGSGVRLPGPGRLVAIDSASGRLRLRRRRGSTAPHPRALVPPKPIPTVNQRRALHEVAQALLLGGIDGPGPYAAARRLLGRRPPLFPEAAAGAPLVEPGEGADTAAVRLACSLHRSYLAVQGPPGSGKTRVASRMVVELVRSGAKVGITGNSHAVISHLLRRVIDTAAEEGHRVRAVQKTGAGHEGCRDPDVEITTQNEVVAEMLSDGRVDVVAGTPWLLTREEMRGRLGAVLVDEAGQLSLAEVLAVATATSDRLILVGDPRQLAQPSSASHPEGADASALEHVIGGHGTIPADRGVFLDHTWRLHPGICAFISEQVYEGRLHSRPECALQSVDAGPVVGGSGLRWMPVAHHGNRTSSEEEAEAVARIVDALAGRPWADRDGLRVPLDLSDILVVAPYNAQVNLLTEVLPRGARVGTVDRFQGQEAPVVIVSLTASSADDVPRGMEFLYSRNRLNVAVSRAQALTVVVGSPSLLGVHCRTVEQMRLANVLCRYVEMAEPVALP